MLLHPIYKTKDTENICWDGILIAWCQPNLAPPTTFEVGKFGLALLRWGETMPDQKLFGPIKLSGRALYDDGQMIKSDVINHVTKERLG